MIETVPLGNAAEAYGRMMRSEARSRIVLVISATIDIIMRMEPGRVRTLTPHKDFQSSQFSTLKSGILAKSDRLRVNNRPSWTRQMAAIFKSIVPQRRR